MRPLFLILLLTACNSPSPAFRTAVSGEAEVDGSRFAIHAKGDRVEVFRLSREWRPAVTDIHARAHQAIETATGCSVVARSLNGDVAIIRARIAC